MAKVAAKKAGQIDYARFDSLTEELSVSTLDTESLVDQIAVMLTASNEAELKIRFHIRFMARRLAPDGVTADALQRAKEVLALKNAGAKTGDRRTPVQEAAYAASRAAWSKIRKKAGIEPADGRGGNRSDPMAYLKRQASKLLAYAEKNSLGNDVITLLEQFKSDLDGM